jgi:riboflavin synthase
MFTGIVETVGHITRLEPQAAGLRMGLAAGTLDLSDVRLGDSIAVSGPCLTVVACGADGFEVDVSSETLARTTLGGKRVGAPVNLEKALRLSDRLGGHLVSGHVDGVGELRARIPEGEYLKLVIGVPAELARYLAGKGSIAIDGVSLTINAAGAAHCEVLTIPHTLERTTLGGLAPGDRVNLEVDLIARYIERLLTAAAPDDRL